MSRQARQEGITPREAEVYAALKRLLTESRHTPTQVELAHALGITPKVARDHLVKLRRYGKVTWDYCDPRTLEITADIRPDEIVRYGKPVSGRRN